MWGQAWFLVPGTHLSSLGAAAGPARSRRLEDTSAQPQVSPRLLCGDGCGLTDGLDGVAAVHKVPLVHVDGELKQAAQLEAAGSWPHKGLLTPAYRLVTGGLLEDAVSGTHDGAYQDL